MKRNTDELKSAEAVILGLGATIEARDPCTNGHCQRLAHYAAKLVQSASATAKTVLRELMVGTNGATPEERLANSGLSSEQVDRARTELRVLGFAAMRQVIIDNSLAFAVRRRP